MFGRLAAGKTRDGEIKAAPEKMHGAGLADKTGAEFLEDFINRRQRSPETVDRRRVIAGMRLVLITGYRVRNLSWHSINVCLDAELAQTIHQLLIKARDRARNEDKTFHLAGADGDDQLMRNKIEINLECSITVGDRRGRQAPTGHIQRHMPTVVEG